ncbi:MAG: SIR2 family protein [Myxococcales bacterium]|nr:SIR2 family protein [Myxococcales bacterium]
MQAPDELLRAFSQRDLIVCVGPGVGTDQPDARALAERLAELAAQDDPSLELEDLRNRITAGQVADVLQLTHRVLGDRFDRAVQDLLGDPGGALPPLLAALARLRPRLRAIYTTRLDRIIERALEGRWPSFDSPRSDLVQRRNMVFKVFGSLENPSTWVLTRAQVQRELGPDAERHEIFAAAFRAHQMLFVGFEPDAPELAQLLDMAPAAAEGRGPGHFIALERCSRPDRELLEGQGIHVVEGDSLVLLEALAETLKGRTIIEPILAPQPIEPTPGAPPGPAPRSSLPRWPLLGALGLVAIVAIVVALRDGHGDAPSPSAAAGSPSEPVPPRPENETVPVPVAEASSTGSPAGAPGPTSDEATTSTGATTSASDEATDDPHGETTEAPAISSPPRPKRCHCLVGDLGSCTTEAQAAAKGLRCAPDPHATGKRGCSPTYFCR